MSAEIKAVQQRLIEFGYDLGRAGADGVAGRMTTKAIAEFQADKKLAIKYPGTIGPITLQALGLTAMPAMPPWIELAKSKMGLHEARDKSVLSMFLKSDGHALGDPTKLPWCGDFVETCIAVSLPNEPMIANPYWALNWLKFGVAVNKDAPVMGAVGAATRNGGGHVFFVVGHDKDNYHALGGNQSNSVSIVKMPKDRVVGLRYPRTYQMPTTPLGFSVFNGKISTNEA